MLKRTILATLAAAALTVATYAQESATIVLRSGEKVSGQLIDMGAAGFQVKVNGQDRQIANNDVAVIDFTGNGDMSDEDWAKVGDSGLLLRSGQAIKGQLIDVGGTSPLRLSVRTETGERDFTSSDVRRIVLARPTSTAAATGTSGSSSTMSLPGGDGIAVSATQAWTPTGITVRRGDVIRFTATGEARLSTDAADMATATGARSQRRSQTAPLPDTQAGALIGRVGNGTPFPIGESQTVTMPAAGQLFLGINDDHVADNQGGFRVVVQRQGRQ
jgi:hypothetical protein